MADCTAYIESLEQFAGEYRKLVGELADARAEVMRMEMRKASMHREMDAIATHRDQLLAQATALTKERDELRAKVTEWVAECNAKESIILQLQRSSPTAALRDRLTKLEMAVAAAFDLIPEDPNV